MPRKPAVKSPRPHDHAAASHKLQRPDLPAPVAPMTRGDWLLIAGLTLLHLLTFINKPPHIDDTLYLETAKGIIEHPSRPLTNTINWEMIPRPIYLFAVNPPLYNYQQALVVKLFGWNMPMLHLLAACYVFLAALSMFYLARRFTPWPRMALLTLMLSPTLLPQTNLMLDVPAMALLAATVAAWIKGIDQRFNKWMLIAALAATAAFSTKYNSVVVLPLVLLYSVFRKRWASLLWLAMPLAGLGVWRIWNAYIFPNGAFHLTIAKERFDASTRYWYQQLMLALMSWGGAFFFLPAAAVWMWIRRRVGMALFVLIPALTFFIVEAIITLGPWTDSHGSLFGAAVLLTKSLGFNWILQPYSAWKMEHWPEQLFFVANGLLMLTFILIAVFQGRSALQRRDRQGAGGAPLGGRSAGRTASDAERSPLPHGRGSEMAHGDDTLVRDDLFLLAWLGGMTLFNCLYAPHHAPRYYFPAYPAMALLLIRAAGRLCASDQRSAISGQPDNAESRMPKTESSELSASHQAPSTGNREPGTGNSSRFSGHLALGTGHFQPAWLRNTLIASLAIQAVVGLLLVTSDNTFAQASQDAVERIAKHPAIGKKNIFYVGHWGFQFHAQQHANFHVMDVRQAPPPVGGIVAVVMDTGWGEFPRWLKKGNGGFEEFTTESALRTRDGQTVNVKFRIIDEWDYPHWPPLQTVSLDQKLLIYSPRFYHNRLPYGFGGHRSHRVLLLEREM